MFTLVLTLLAVLDTTVIFIIDVVLVAVVRSKVKDKTDGNLSSAHVLSFLLWLPAPANCAFWDVFVPQVWTVPGVVIALWISIVGACCGICGKSGPGTVIKSVRYQFGLALSSSEKRDVAPTDTVVHTSYVPISATSGAKETGV
ncbi:hypothetical protein EW146_g1757 [Bondarzewia mesenterica]|uniref:Uncharacterized protein n=1 Tax=Bondarzewia mesenterica TaxID=1095465 RepID=A0A4S4M915_9AGAM|nr:hypothetical protein EW146_g1757 [Bondarzewia mesenterica]